MSPQCKAILNHIQQYGSITQLEAAKEYGCFRLSARIWDLKQEEYKFRSETVHTKNRFGKTVCFTRYSLV